MANEELKRAAALAALEYIEDDMVVGVGTGSTTNYFIDALATIKHRIEATVASSTATEERLKAHDIRVLDLNVTNRVHIYVDGADETNRYHQLIKGGGGALTREKILAAAADRFVCIADASKRVEILGSFPLPVAVIPMARSYVAREIVKLGGDPEYLDGVVTDDGNIILRVHNLEIMEPAKLESTLNGITGVVCNGLFAIKPADIVLLGTDQGVEVLK